MNVFCSNLQRHRTVNPTRIRAWALSVLSVLKLEQAEIGLILVGDRKIRELNRLYRGKDCPTNVLSFPLEGLPPRDGRPHLLGDVVISVETAWRESKDKKLSLQEHLKILMVHGILHLAGMDHERSSQEAKRMARTERRLLKHIGSVQSGLI